MIATLKQVPPSGHGEDVVDSLTAFLAKAQATANSVAAELPSLASLPEKEFFKVLFVHGGLRNVFEALFFLSVFMRSRLSGPSDVYLGVAQDLEARAQVGERKYGTRLKTNNGREALVDLYQEVLDSLNYCEQALLEGKL